jgi:hypothetical protein
MQLLIDGKFNKKELKELEEKLKEWDIEVGRYFTRGIDAEEIVRLLLRDFDAYTFLRNGTLFTLLANIARRAIEWVKTKKNSVKIQTGFELEFSRSDGQEVRITLGVPVENNRLFWQEIKTIITIEFVNGIQKGEIVSITWDNERQKIKIVRF